MYEKVKSRYSSLKAKNPNLAEEIMEKYMRDNPEMAMTTLDQYEYGCHIKNREQYDEGMSLLRWADGMHSGAKWEVETIKTLCGIKFDADDFAEEDFSLLDFCAEVNTLWSDHLLTITDPSIYFKMAKQNLTDVDYPYGDPSERAYKMLVKRIENNKQD